MFPTQFTSASFTWEQQELGAVVEFYSGLTYKPENVVQNGTLVIRSSNIHNNQYINADNVYVKNNIVNSEYVQEQDIIVVVRNGSRNLIGKHALLKSIPHDPSVIGAFMTGIRSLNNQFIEAVLNTEKFKREINKNLGATINQITTSQFKKMKFNFPKREEDKQIGILFNYLDDTIQLHERKCEELALIKKALLQKLFPKKDEFKPEVRYKNFSDAWEQRKLGEILKERKERSSIGELISVTINNGVVKADSLERKDNSSSDKSNYKVVCKGDIAYNSMRMWQGASGYSPYNGILSPAYTVLIPTEKVDSKFISYMFKKEKMLQQFQKYSQGLTPDTWNLKYPMLKDIPVLFPKIDEQVSIRKHLDNISSLIALHQRKLEKLKQLKKFLLQNMFI